MGSYYEHKRTVSVTLPYSFRCEHCMSDSGPLCATVSGAGTKDSISKRVSEKDEEKMYRKAHKQLVMILKRIHKDIVQKQVYTSIFTDECPHCHKPQSWGISIAKENMYTGMLVFLIMGVFFGAGSLMGDYLGDIDYENIPVAVGIVVVAVVAAAVSLIRNINKVNKKKKMLSTAVQKNLPVIDWDVVQYLLDEQ